MYANKHATFAAAYQNNIQHRVLKVKCMFATPFFILNLYFNSVFDFLELSFSTLTFNPDFIHLFITLFFLQIFQSKNFYFSYVFMPFQNFCVIFLLKIAQKFMITKR